MKTKNLKNKLISVLAAAVMLAGILPASAADAAGYSMSITDAHDWDAAANFNEAGGSSCLVMQISAAELERGSYVEYSVYAEDESAYNLEFKSSPIADGSYTSPATVTLNGVDVNASLKKSIDTNTKIYSAAVVLNPGENKIRFTVTGKKPNAAADGTGEQGLFHLYYVNVTEQTSGTIVEGNTLIVEAQNYADASHSSLTELSASNCYGGSYYYFPVITTGTVFLQYNVVAPATGEYSMELFASDRVTWLGRWELLINGEKVGDTSEGGIFQTGPSYAAANNTWFVRKFSPVTVNLNEGENTILIRSYEGGPNNNNRGFALDCFKFTKDAIGSLKFEEINGKTNGSQYSGTLALQMFYSAASATGDKNTYTLTAPAGEYDLYVCACSSVWTSYLGTIAFNLNNAGLVDFTTDNVTKIASISDIGGKFKYNTPITLTGEDTLVIENTAVAAAGTNNYVLYDYFELVPKDAEIATVDLMVDENKLAVGETLQASSQAYYENGYICSDMLIESVTYTSSNTNVATVDEDGIITGMNPGLATITVTYNDTYTASVKVSVYDESGIVPFASSYDEENTKATVKLARIGEGTGDAVVIIGAYSVDENGNDVSYENVQLGEASPAYGRVKTVAKTITGEQIRAFVWDSISGMKPLSDPIELK
ncbi:MAG: Ig-like domain-containing protein [Clostridia bacterium]|nr:Ig-like domain-containing protein [Clostridia bacterium]